MTSGNHPINERIQDLLADRALHGLSMDESEELARLAVDSGTSTDDTLESTAAILHEALLLEGELEDLPRDLESRLMQSAAFLAPVEAPSPAQTPTTARDSSLGWIAASVAAAAALVMMVSLVFSRPDPTAASTPRLRRLISSDRPAMFGRLTGIR